VNPSDLASWLDESYVPIFGAESPGGEPAGAVADPPAGGETPPGENGEPGEGEPAAPEEGERIGRLEQRMSEVAEGIEDLLGAVQQPGQEPAGEQGLEPEAEGGEELGEPDPTDPNYVQQLIQREAQQAARQMIEPMMEQQEAERRETQAEQLLEDYPELRERDAAREVLTEAQEWARDLRNPALAAEPAFIELVLLAAKTAERAEQETPAGQAPEGVQLEAAGGSNPGSAPTQPQETAQRILDAGSRNGFWT
jgi:hypothetical protein